MDNNLRDLAHAITMKFNTAPQEPTHSQLNDIIRDIDKISKGGHKPTDEEWRLIVEKHCPTAGSYKYAGIDTSDLNTLLIMAKKN